MSLLHSYAFIGSMMISLLAIVRIIQVDLTRFEIDFAASCVLAISGLLTALLGEANISEGTFGNSFDIALDAIITGSFCAVGTAIVCWLRPAHLGRGDIVLLGVMGLVAGSRYLPLLMASFVLLIIATAATYSILRGKRLFRSAFPAAIPGMTALGVVMMFKHVSQDADQIRPLEVLWVSGFILSGLVLQFMAERQRR